MWEGKRGAEDWLKPLLWHCLVNAIGTGIALLLLGVPYLLILGLMGLEILLHAVIDRNKPISERLFGNRIATLIDQSLHQATYLIIYFLM